MVEELPLESAPRDPRYWENALGVLLFDSDLGRLAACWKNKHSCDPQNAPANCADCVWLANMPAGFLRENANFPDQATVHPDGWLGATWNTIIAEWGFSNREAFDNARSLSRIATVSAVVMDKTLEHAFGANWKASASQRKSILRLPCIESSLAKVFDLLLQRTRPKERAFAEAAKSLQHCGVKSRSKIRRNAANEIDFHVHYPKIRYADALAAKRTPAAGKWVRIKMPDPRTTLSGKTLGFLLGRDRPIVVVGRFHPKSPDAPLWVRCWTAGSGERARSAFTLEECEILLEHGDFVIHDAYEGPGWLERPEDAILGKCVSALKSACGGELVARNSWSAGLAAHMFIKSIVSRAVGRSSIPVLEAAWLAAADRMKMIRAIKVLQDAGCIVLSASTGTIRARTRVEPEQLSRVFSAVWREGLVLPIAHARKFKSSDAQLPGISQAFEEPLIDRFPSCGRDQGRSQDDVASQRGADAFAGLPRGSDHACPETAGPLIEFRC